MRTEMGVMMLRKISPLALAAVLSLSLGLPVHAGDAQSVSVTVKGMVCSFCATGLKKVFSKEPGITAVDVKLEEKKIHLQVKDAQQPNDERLKELVRDAGYEPVEILRKTSEKPAAEGRAS